MTRTQYERRWATGSAALSVLALTHPTGVLVFGASACLLCLVAQKTRLDLGLAFLLTLALMFAQAASGVMNDLFDVDLDRAAKPWRGLPAGLVTVRQARALAAAFIGLAIFTSALVSPASCAILCAGITVSGLYSGWLKRTCLSWVPYVVAYPSLPVWVWISLGAFRVSLVNIYWAGLALVLGVHLVNQLRDYEEDEWQGVRGFVQCLGKPKAILGCFALLAIAPVPLLLTRKGEPNPAFAAALWGAAFLHWLLIVPGILKSGWKPEATEFRRIFRALQVSAPLLTAAWLLAV